MSRPFRHTLILTGAALGTLLAAVGGWRYARASAPLSGPVILISIDTLRADHLPAYGYAKGRTPEIDRLAHDGVVFDRAYSHSPQTLPAHIALLSGRLPFETGVRDDEGAAVKSGERLLPGMLHDRGYSTGGVVSAAVLRKDSGIAAGFDFFDAEMAAGAADMPAPSERDGLESERIAERWLSSVGTARAFLFLHLNEPHAPYHPPDKFSALAPYDGEIASADEIVGRLLQYLKSHQLYDRSTIILLADHGEGLGDHGEQTHGLFVYDEAVHVPLIIKQEGNIGAGRRIDVPVQHIDLVPTILDLVKAPAAGDLRGRSLKPLLDGARSLPDRALYAEAMYGHDHFGWSALTSVFDGRYRYINATRPELYDSAADRGERLNLAADHDAQKAALAAALADFVKPEAVEGPAAADPKDKVHVLEAYRRAVALADARSWPEAVAAFQHIVRDDPDLAEVWGMLASSAGAIDRFDVALDAHAHVLDLRPESPGAHLAAADAFFRAHKIDEARDHAQQAADLATERELHLRAAAHLLLARIALVWYDEDNARTEAGLAHAAVAQLPAEAYVEGRLLYDQADYDGALARFQDGITAAGSVVALQIPELHYYTGDTLARLERTDEAQAEFLAELRYFPENIRARGALASLDHANGDAEGAATVLGDLTRLTPTPEAYATAARLWKSFGNPRQADATRAEGKKVVSRQSMVISH